MKKMMIAVSLIVLGTSVVQADIVADFVTDGGFEALSTANSPNLDTTPWFTKDESNNFSIQREDTIVNSGTYAVAWQYYFNDPSLIQTLGVQVEAGKDYEIDFWHALGEQSGNTAHTNATAFNVSIWTSATVDGTYTYAAGKFGIAATALDGTYENYNDVYGASALSAKVGEYMQLRFVKTDVNTTHRIFVDDVSFGAVIPEPATIGLVGLAGIGLIAARRFRK